jgi:hypothetical protein
MRELPAVDLLDPGAPRFPVALAVGVNECVGEDPEQPRLEVGALLELVERCISLREGLLHQVIRVSWVPRHLHPSRVQLI